MPFGKFQRLAGCTIAPHGGAFEFWWAAKDCSDWIIAANMEYQPLRYRLSGHGLTRDYPRIHRVTRYPRVNRPVIQGHSETSDAKGCQERIDQLLGEDVLTCFALAVRPLSGRVIICGEMPFGKFQRLAVRGHISGGDAPRALKT